MVSTSMVIPPKSGIAIGTIISEPLPVEVITGILEKEGKELIRHFLYFHQKFYYEFYK